MSLDISYQGLPLAKGASGRFEEGGLFVAVDAPMPVATHLSLSLGDHQLTSKVRRVREGTGAGMILTTVDGSKLPRWLISVHPETAAAAAALFEAEPPPPPPVVETPAPSAPEAAADAAPSAHTPEGDGDGSAGAAGDDDEDGKATSSAKKPAAGAKKPAKKSRKR